MHFSERVLIKFYIVFLTATSASCWQFFTSVLDYTLSNSKFDPEHIHSEYYFGDCKRESHIFYTHTHLDHLQILGKVIVRGWIDVPRIPTCILLRGTGFEDDMFRSTTYNFQMCVPRITYCHTHHRFKYHYYEWYLPPDVFGGMNWDIYFFGPPTLDWG
ncbi:hypothetical protein B5X24_HaOG202162 [Helicoverpa armigera]|uniref:Uncharacterized protein n=1 Tax=Helicoverpa armigera TaxID=29058 RepID=A0A2W1BTM3_HELAM|nr:hypothetical protein B5X24_HaOG202162 [Helicoverpa armigera]